MYGAKSLGVTALTPFILDNTREGAAAKAFKAHGRAYIVTYELIPMLAKNEYRLAHKRVYHPDDIKA
jgi:hypothetical protein